MNDFTVHTLETVPQASKDLVEKSIQTNGMLPNLHAVMAEAPGLLEGYQVLHKLFSESSFNAQELTVVWQTLNVEHECHYCVPAHTAIAHMMKIDPELTQALRDGDAMPNEKLQALHDTTLAMTRSRGHLTSDEMKKFFDAGFTQQQLLEIVLGIAQKVMSNYTNHLANTPLDDVFKPFFWK